MADAPEFAAVALDVEAIDDHRQPGLEVESGVSLHWAHDGTERFLQDHVAALRNVAADQHQAGRRGSEGGLR